MTLPAATPQLPAAARGKSIAILGAGITGLTAAYRLVQQGHHVRVFEQSGRIGGAIRTEETAGWLIEGGPNSLLSGEPALARLIAELGLTGEQRAANPAAKNRYIVRNGRAVAAPTSPPAFLKTSLFSVAGKLALLSELLSRPRIRSTDVSLAEFGRAHFGQEFVDYALDPFVNGVYAGNPAKLSAKHSFPKLWELDRTHGSLIRGQISAAKARRKTGAPRGGIISFRHGLQTLTDALGQKLPAGAIALNASLQAIVPGEKWNVVWNDPAGTHTQAFDATLVALPAHALAQLRIGAFGERPLAGLAAVEHPPVSSLFLGYRREQIAHPLDGFGVLAPSLEKRSVLGVLFSSSLFADRAPEGHVALTVMAGGARQPEIAALPTDRLLEIVQPDLEQLLGVRGAPVFIRHTFWPRAIPQYNLGYEQFLGNITAVERAHRALFIGGQAKDGVAVPACIAAGETLAARVSP